MARQAGEIAVHAGKLVRQASDFVRGVEGGAYRSAGAAGG
jgi:hypothetical protein